MILEKPDKLEEAILYYEKAVSEDYEFACLNLSY
jgi:hypothetical protein